MNILTTKSMLFGLCSLLSTFAPVEAFPSNLLQSRVVRTRRRRRFPVGGIVGIVIGVIILLLILLVVLFIMRKARGRKQKKLATGGTHHTETAGNYPMQQTTGSGYPTNNQPVHGAPNNYNNNPSGYAPPNHPPPAAGGAAQDYYK